MYLPSQYSFKVYVSNLFSFFFATLIQPFQLRPELSLVPMVGFINLILRDRTKRDVRLKTEDDLLLVSITLDMNSIILEKLESDFLLSHKCI